jgi:hypothetical protein
MARQAALPVRGEKAERLPALVTPRIRHVSAIEYDVIDRLLCEEPARREAGMTGPDDDRSDALDGYVSLAD